MGVTIKEYEWSEPVMVADYVSDRLEHGEDYGKMDTIQRDVRTHNEVISRLFQHLADKGLLTAEDVETIVRGV